MSETIVVEKSLLKSKAFRSLNGTAKNVFFDFLMKRRFTSYKIPGSKRKGFNLSNQGQLEYCYSEAEKNGIPRASFMRALDDLINNGLIDLHKRGSGTRKGDKSHYGISERWRKFGTADFVEARRAKDNRKGRGFAIYWKRKKLQL
jgi:hypothetical protein